MKLFLRLLVALVAVFLNGAGAAHAYSHRQIAASAPRASVDFHAKGAATQLQQLSYRPRPARKESKLVRIVATDDNDEDEDENSAPSAKPFLAPSCSVECSFVPLPAFDEHPVSRSVFSREPLALSATRRFIRLRVIRL